MIEFTILGQCYSLKNTRDIFPIKADKGAKCPHCKKPLRMMTIPNEKAKLFEADFSHQLPESAQQDLSMPIGVKIAIYYPSNLQDLDEALVLDLLQRYKVIHNDRQIVRKIIDKFIDSDEPRVEVCVVPMIWNRSGLQPSLFGEELPAGIEEAVAQ